MKKFDRSHFLQMVGIAVIDLLLWVAIIGLVLSFSGCQRYAGVGQPSFRVYKTDGTCLQNWVTPTGTKYHCYDCPYLKTARSNKTAFIPYDLSKYTPCSRCRPSKDCYGYLQRVGASTAHNESWTLTGQDAALMIRDSLDRTDTDFIQEFTGYWLDCHPLSEPYEKMDINRDGITNFVDFALLSGVKDE